MLRANDIVPRNPEPLEPQVHTHDIPTTSGTSIGKGETSKVKREAVEEGLGSDTDDENSMREKALLVCFRLGFSYTRLPTIYHRFFFFQAEVQRCQAEVEKIRKERNLRDTGSERPRKKLKREDKSHFIPGEIIDLT